VLRAKEDAQKNTTENIIFRFADSVTDDRIDPNPEQNQRNLHRGNPRKLAFQSQAHFGCGRVVRAMKRFWRLLALRQRASWPKFCQLSVTLSGFLHSGFFLSAFQTT
jgi:hypothetical protein